ncbi:ceramidase like protein [Neohortaea acidophila]|uniref:Neutral ceramidase n=1 Tax=Neohortaea acidophila TaxID=245834 RepID=A0A6A6PZR9_9PEZI|nr:ceramidase like protein [Neohortaea acidophila]KAF2485244.1 ceramidase like protein [Neohortaea acidophila]
MARSNLHSALLAGLLITLSSFALLFSFGGSGSTTWLWSWKGPLLGTGTTYAPQNKGTQYLLGVGKADITGPVVEINFMGYANTSQVGSGLRQRLYSRAFIIGHTDDPTQRFIYLNLDTQAGDTAVRYGVLDVLSKLGAEYSVYGQHNVAVVGTHSHSGPGAWLNYLLPQITSKGFYKPSYQAIVDGTVASIKLAHANLAPGHLSVGVIQLEDANINRSPYAYLQNPAEERALYTSNVDKNLTLLRFTHSTDSGERNIGMLNWFAVHGTSMLGNNSMVTGDNKGVAAWMFEQSMNDPTFVAGFSQANVGDTSPNTLGAYCEYGPQAGESCDFETSLCKTSGGKNASQPCHGRGPYFGLHDGGAASNYEIGRRQFDAAKRLFDTPSAFTPITGNVVKSLHHFVELSNYRFPLPNGTMVKTCPAALGYSFAAGTTDGPGAFDFKQGQPNDPHANPLWSVVGGALHSPNETQIACHGVKPILLDVGETNTPYPWSPNIVDIQLFRVGQLFIIVSPGEATTMSGRRWRNAVHQHAASNFTDITDAGVDPVVVLGGPANSYTHYITTPEEYSVQRYEGASTLYGPHTLNAYLNLTLTALPHLSTNTSHLPPLAPGPSPPWLIEKALTFINPVIVDNAGFLRSFGDQVTAPSTAYTPGANISASFVAANPRNNFHLGGTFAAVEKFDSDTSTWVQIRDDSDWSLVFQWKRTSTVLGTSEATISWETEWETGAWRPESGDGLLKAQEKERDLTEEKTASLQGRYRIKYYGDAKSLGGTITPFEGTSAEFTIS